MHRIVILGRPGTGKTTLAKKVVEHFPGWFRGFYTEEIREGKERVGFGIRTLSGKEGILAKKGNPSPLRVGRYGIMLYDLETIGIEEIENALLGGFPLLIDEVGKMELFSSRFREVFYKAWYATPFLLVTSCFPPLSELDHLFQGQGVRKVILDRRNRDRLGKVVIEFVERFYKSFNPA
ncbi:MAG: nucleoside-triphosphatase [Atribacterota bacterium]